MTLPGTERTRVEILVDAPLVPQIVTLLGKHAIRGHTVMPTLSGEGEAGTWDDDLITSAQHKVTVLVVAEPGKADAFIEDIRPLLDSYGLIVMLSTINVLRPEKFA
ncbi:hypothetical protein FY036_02435 [Mesorhizobium microcysteis]|jgi:PII-like signaling protein|uniref:Nitrogen regulatory protein P-II n=1 Tax=Neoaquamicrobium microcysteis TaxID=2682781 RepID=A0A5D4H630_9HYPH|nr:DUF190 domain-containing protein [Mesorhizobium microcysteis]TYR35489.1 hypothetical protein FY036_02435 [Mesorhizobium microcysteis]